MYNPLHMSKKIRGALGATLVLLPWVFIATSYAQSQVQAPEIAVEEIIRKFSEKEKEFKLARANYAFRQEIKVQELSDSDRVLGTYETTTEISFDDKGRRSEKVVYAPPPTLKRLSITTEDLQGFREIQPFVLTSDEIGKYNLKYAGKEKVDEISSFVFEVSPRKLEKDQQYFEGKIWVDDKDFQIVKTYGKQVPDKRTKGGGENLFPKFETYREQIDEYWFPTYTRAVDTLDFESGKQKMREIIRYGNYKRFQSSVKLKFGGEVTDEKGAPAAEAPPSDKTAPALDPKYKSDPKQDPKKK
jgi:hypothetical protein